MARWPSPFSLLRQEARSDVINLNKSEIKERGERVTVADGKVVNRQSKMNFINADCLSYEKIQQPLLIANVCRFTIPTLTPSNAVLLLSSHHRYSMANVSKNLDRKVYTKPFYSHQVQADGL